MCDLCTVDEKGYHELKCPNNPIKTDEQLMEALVKEGLLRKDDK